MSEENALVFECFSKRYGALQAVDDLTLNIPKGSLFGFLGPNGAGKSTTINAILGKVRPTSGSIFINGVPVGGDRSVYASVGFAPQEIIIDDWFFTVREILVCAAGYYGIEPRDAGERADRLLEELELSSKSGSKVKTLSGGMKRRVLLAKALIHDPDILILDEPTAGADVGLRTKLWGVLRRLHREGKTILLTTHYLEEAEQLCDRLAIMDHGKLLHEGRTEELLASFHYKMVVLPRRPEFRISSKIRIHERRRHVEFLVPTRMLSSFLSKVAGEFEERDVAVGEARLEDVFLEVMDGAGG